MIALLAGLGTGLSLIIAIGAQNAYVLRQGLRREHVLAVVAICALSDLALITAGVGGLGFLVQTAPVAILVIRFVGAAFLITYGVLAAVRAARPSRLDVGAAPQPRSLRSAVVTAIAFTWLNPHVYLDTVLLLGGVAATYGDARWLFAAGAGAASILWFAALGYGARLLAPLFARPVAWRVLDVLIALVMIALGATLAVAGPSGN